MINLNNFLTHIFRYLKPKSIDELRQNPPETLKEYEEEIFKQQNLLEYLHEQVDSGKNYQFLIINFQIQKGRQLGGRAEEMKGKEDQMWAIQTGITVLKRRYKALLDEKEQQKKGRENEEFDAINDEETGTSMMDESMGPALLEKQLLAVQIAMRDEITEEKRKIGQLLSVLREVSNIMGFGWKEETKIQIDFAVAQQSFTRAGRSKSTDQFST